MTTEDILTRGSGMVALFSINEFEGKMRLVTGVVSAAAILLAVSGTSNATEYLTNGGFETGDLTGFTFSGNQFFQGVTPSGGGYFPSQSGNFHYEAGNTTPATLSQTFSDVVGQTLVVSGWVTGNGTGDVQFAFDGTAYEDILNPQQPYTQYTFDVTATGNDTFGITYFDAPSFLAFDSLSVSSNVSATPLPSTWTMMILGLAGVGFMIYRQRKSGAALAV